MIAWNIATWVLGIPSSSSHALVGGLVGAGTAKAGLSVVVWGGLTKTIFAIVLSPLLGFLLALMVSWDLNDSKPVDLAPQAPAKP